MARIHTAAYVIDAADPSDGAVTADVTDGSFDLTLPKASRQRFCLVRRADDSENDLGAVPADGDTVSGGDPGIVIAGETSRLFVSDLVSTWVPSGAVDAGTDAALAAMLVAAAADSELGTAVLSAIAAMVLSTTLQGAPGIGAPVAAPASADATGVAGSWAFDAEYLYACVATDTWMRTALETWEA